MGIRFIPVVFHNVVTNGCTILRQDASFFVHKIQCIANKSTQRMQTSLAMTTHYPNVARIPYLESQHGGPDHPQNLINLFLVSS